MLVFELKCEEKLPNVMRVVGYRGVGHSEFEKLAGVVGVSPDLWSRDYPQYLRSCPEMMELKRLLNSAKSRIDVEGAIPHWIDPLVRLRGPEGLIATEYSGSIVTNAWLKMYEMIRMVSLGGSGSGRRLRSIHVAEAPGNFILAIGHYLADFENVIWTWNASSYRDISFQPLEPKKPKPQKNGKNAGVESSPESKCLKDEYGLIARYPDKWFWGPLGNGDITEPANIRYWRWIYRESCDLFTSDAKVDSLEFSEEENVNLPLQLGQLLCAMAVLARGGSMIIKTFTFFESASIDILKICCTLFKSVRLVKPESSRAYNSEIYVVGVGYKHDEVIFGQLLCLLDYFRRTPVGSGGGVGRPAFFARGGVPRDWIDIASFLTSRQIAAIDRALAEKKVRKKPRKIKTKAPDISCENWIRHYQVGVLTSDKKLI